MSAYKTVKTKQKSFALVIQALERVRPKWAGKIKTSPNGENTLTAKTYSGTTQAAAIINKSDIGGRWADLAVIKQKDGTYSLGYDDHETSSTGLDKDFHKALSTEYNVAQAAVDIQSRVPSAKFGAVQAFNYKGKQYKGFEVEIDEDDLKKDSPPKRNIRVI